MKDLLKDKKAALVLITLYLIFVFTMQFIANDGTLNLLFFVFLFVLAIVSSLVLLYFLYEPVTGLKFKKKPGSGGRPVVLFIILVIITLIIYTVYLLAQLPGGMNPDVNVQFKQGIGESPYNNWHPVIHTLLFFTLPLKFGHNLGIVVFWQILLFSIAFSYMCYVLYKNNIPKLLLAYLCVFVWFNPYLSRLLMYPWKDIALTIFAMVLMAYYIEILCSKGAWMKNKLHIVLFCADAVLCTYMRHNAVLFTLPLVLIVIIYMLHNNKERIVTAAGFIAFYALILILYAIIGVEKGDGAMLQKVGFPLTIWCNVMQKDPGSLPDEMTDYMYSIATVDAYENSYVAGDFNSLRNYDKIDLFSIDELDYGTVFKFTWYCLTKSPKASFEAMAKLTSLVWSLDGNDDPVSANIEENEWGITKAPVQFEGLVSQMYTFFMIGAGRIVFGSIGLMLLIIFVIASFMVSARRISFIHALPILCYDFGTMFFLNGGDYRFFMLTLPLWIAVVFVMIKDEKSF